jgi:lipopolysaccharide export system protein LptA
MPLHLNPTRAMSLRPGRALRSSVAALMLASALAVAPSALAERADRSQPMVVEADRPGTFDMQRQIVTFSGNVVIVQGTMQIRADRVEVRESKDGHRSGVASGTPTQRATFRQKRDGVEEFMEAEAQRIEFDSRTDTLRFTGDAVVRRLQGTRATDEITGQLITWNNATEVFNVEGGAPTAQSPSGRVRAVLAPRADSVASPPAPARGTGASR